MNDRSDLPSLSSSEAERLRKEGKDNRASADAGKSVPRIIAGNVFTLFNLLNIALAAALFAVGAWRNALFLGVVVSNTLIGIVQELRAKATVDKLRLQSESPVTVIRDGAATLLPPENTVLGDTVVLHAGDQVPADAEVISGECAVCESLITGEQDEIPKNAGDALFSGSYLTSGGCACRLCAVGDDSFINRMTKSAKRINTPQSKLMNDLRKIIRTVSAVLIPVGILLFCKEYFILGEGPEVAVPTAVASMIGMIPEGLILLVSVALTVGVVKLARKRTLVRELYGIENLARVDTLCLDKTGTLTTGNMTLDDVLPCGTDRQTLERDLAAYLGATDDLSSPTARAIAARISPVPSRAVSAIPFSSRYKYAAVTTVDGKTFALGAPSFLPGKGMTESIARTIAGYARDGARVLAFARSDCPIADGVLPSDLEFEGLLVIRDEIRPDARECMNYFREQGVTPKIISGDDPRTVASVAQKAGVAGAEGSFVDLSLLEDREIEQTAEDYTVFGRVTPERKLKLVEALRKKGKTVAMTGDGVNDIPALKAADCSVAMASGSDATRRSSQIVLLDSSFSSLPGVVLEGRRVINNIGRTASLFLVKTVFSCLLSIIMLFLPGIYPFQPIQLTLISTLTIGLPSFLLTFEPDDSISEKRFLLSVFLRALPGGIAVALCSAASAVLAGVWGSEISSTIATVSAGITGIFVLFCVSRPFTRLRAAVFSAVCLLFAAAVLIFGKVFYLVPLTPPQLGVLAAVASAGVGITALLTFVFRKIRFRFFS